MILIYKRQMTIFEAYLPFVPQTQGCMGKILFCRQGRESGLVSASKKARLSRAFLTTLLVRKRGIWCPEEDSNLHTLSSTST